MRKIKIFKDNRKTYIKTKKPLILKQYETKDFITLIIDDGK